MSDKEIYEELGGVWGEDCPKYKKQLKLGLRSLDAPGPTLVENWGSGR